MKMGFMDNGYTFLDRVLFAFAFMFGCDNYKTA